MSQHQKALPKSDSETTTTHLPESFQKTLKATASLFNALLSDDVLRIWKDMLNLCSEPEAVRALKKWQYEGVYFPKPQEILQLIANERDAQKIENEGCSTECQRRHGLGYGTNDVRWLLARRMEDQGKKWTEAQWEALIAELDAKRHQGPVSWRAA